MNKPKHKASHSHHRVDLGEYDITPRPPVEHEDDDPPWAVVVIVYLALVLAMGYDIWDLATHAH